MASNHTTGCNWIWNHWRCQTRTNPPAFSYSDSDETIPLLLYDENLNGSGTRRRDYGTRSEPDTSGWHILFLSEHEAQEGGPAPAAMQASSSSQAQLSFGARQWYLLPGGANQRLASGNDEVLGAVGGAAAAGQLQSGEESSDSFSTESSDEDLEQVYDLEAAYNPCGILRSIRESWPCYVKMLPEKVKLPVGAMFWAYVATCDTPYNFLIKPMYCTNDGLGHFMTDALYWDYSDQRRLATPTKISLASSLDLAYHGRSGLRLIQRYLPEPRNWLLECMRPIFDLEQKLNRFLKRGQRYRDFQRDTYDAFHELVAVRDEFRNWHRGVVLVINEMNEGGDGRLGMVTVRLIDHGYVQVISMNNVCGLPRQFAEMGCYLYTCAAAGVVPPFTDAIWTKTANANFRKNVIWKRAFVTVLDHPESEEGHLGPFDYNPYWVRISTTTAFGNLSDAAVKLVRSGYAVPFNEYTMTECPIDKENVNELIMYHIKYDRTARWIESVCIENEFLKKLEDTAGESSCT